MTLLELLVTLALVGILAALAYPSYQATLLRAHRTEAIDALKKALGSRPGFAAAHYALGKQLEVTGDLPGAIAQYQEAVRLEPGMVPAHNNLAVARFRTGDYRGAWESVRRCRERGFEPAAGFLRALGERFPEPAGQ